MPLATGKAAFKTIMKNYMMTMSRNTDTDRTDEEWIEEYLEVLANATIALVQNGEVVPTLLIAPNGPVTGTGTIL